MSTNPPGTIRRRLRKIFLGSICAIIAATAGLPWICRLPMIRRLLTARATAILAPGAVEFSAIDLSWFGNTRITDVILRDAQGDPVVSSPRVEFNWNLAQILFSQPMTATLHLPTGSLDIERRPDGTVDLYETLRPIIDEHPKRQLIIQIDDAKLRFRDPGLAQPLVADHAKLTLDLAIESLPITWDLDLKGHPAPGQADPRLEFAGSFLRPPPSLLTRAEKEGEAHPIHQIRQTLGDALLKVKADNWPLALAIAGAAASGRWHGEIEANHRPDRWSLRARGRVADLVASAASLGPTNLRHPRLDAQFEASGKGRDWEIHQMNLSTPLDLQTNKRSAASSSSSQVSPADSVSQLLFKAKASYAPDHDRLEVGPFLLNSPLGQVTGQGAVITPGSRPVINVAGEFRPNWQALTQQLSERIEPGARIVGQPTDWRLSGTVSEIGKNPDFRALHAEFSTRIDQLEVFGVRLNDAHIQVRLADGNLTCDPIDATLNEGSLHVEPVLDRDKSGGLWLLLGPSSQLRGALINEEVSHRVLSFAAPVLDGATRVQGKISVAPVQMAFPLGANEAPARVEGNLLFDEVRFMPGPLAAQLIQFFMTGARPSLALRDPISVRIADRKVFQRGLKLPIAQFATIGLDGSVDFDRNLDLVARLSLNREADRSQVLSSFLQAARLEIPIRGTLSEPRIDGDGMKRRMKSVGTDLIDNSVQLGVEGLGQILKNIGKRRERKRNPQ